DAGLFGLGATGGIGAQPDHDLNAGVLEVEGVGVPLGAVAEDRDGLAVELPEVGVFVVEDVVGSHGPAGYRSALRISLPEGVRGRAAASSTRFGTLKPASDSAQCRRRSSGVASEPLSSTTTAVTACCHSGSSRPITAASATS